MMNSSFSQTISSQTSVNIAVERIVARQLNDDGIVRETIHELAPAPVLTSQISRPHNQPELYDFELINASNIRRQSSRYNNFCYFILFPWTYYTFPSGKVGNYTVFFHEKCLQHVFFQILFFFVFYCFLQHFA